MLFKVVGPFELKRFRAKKLFTSETRTALKEAIKAADPSLLSAHGCYVVAVKAARGWTPLYAGQACRTTIWSEATNPHNFEKYSDHMGDRDRGRPFLFLLPWITNTYRNRKRPTKDSMPELDYLEDWLIEKALRRNPDLINSHRTKLVQGLEVLGVLNPRRGEATNSSRELKRVLFGRKPSKS